MIAKSYILANLRQLQSAYDKSSGKHSLYFSKLAILELCGWIEMSVDDIVERYSRKILKEQNNITAMEDAISGVYGFHYKKHFRKMLTSAVGLAGVEKIESIVPPVVMVRLTSQLGSLSTMRNSLAHTYVKGKPGTLNIDAPSTTIGRFQHVYEGLVEVEKALKTL